MKLFISIAVFLLLNGICANGKETSFTGSTPAAPVIRAFLGIPQADSVDFIRWKLNIRDGQYTLACNYGIGKPNTNGFINGGHNVAYSGPVEHAGHYFIFHFKEKVLNATALNPDLLFLLDNNKHTLVGNGGWSYALNNLSPSHSSQANFFAHSATFTDSIAFEGRTPCAVPGVIPAGTQCYKLKWYLVLYRDGPGAASGNYKILGTAWRQNGGRTGKWTMKAGPGGRISYLLIDEKDQPLVYLTSLDAHLLAFTDEKGQFLVGNEDFSYVLNERQKK